MKDLKRIKIVDVLRSTEFGKVVNVKGWVRTKRASKNVAFIALNDGSTIHNVQIVVSQSVENEDGPSPLEIPKNAVWVARGIHLDQLYPEVQAFEH